MIVCMSRRICVELYRELICLHPEWGSEDDAESSIKVVMTGSASDPIDWQPLIRNKPRREALAKRFRNANDPLKMVLVRDMPHQNLAVELLRKLNQRRCRKGGSTAKFWRIQDQMGCLVKE